MVIVDFGWKFIIFSGMILTAIKLKSRFKILKNHSGLALYTYTKSSKLKLVQVVWLFPIVKYSTSTIKVLEKGSWPLLWCQ